MKKNIAIIGAGGFGRETACCLRAINGGIPLLEFDRFL